jgi:ATP-binding cassette subfamily B protein
MTALVIPIIFIGLLDARLLVVPLLFTVAFIFALRYYMQQLTPVSMEQRMSFAALNASLAESVQGIEVIKVTAQEQAERLKFRRGAQRFRDAFIRQGEVQAWYLPTLILAVAMAAGLLQGAWYVTTDRISVGQLVTFIGLMGLLRFPTMISTFSFALVQMGLVSARRILDLMAEHTELDENVAGIATPIKGKVEFEDVWFSYGSEPVLKGVSFVADPGETIAIVGETGSGKTTLTKLVNRIYDPERGRILIDGIDVKERSLHSLRSQISSIEQDIVLFSRPISENIGFSLGQQTDQAAIERAAKDAQADTFIQELPEGYDTVIGERGVTLSGGQRQRLAIARALLTDPAILVLDDSTSAIDSATEDQIQRAIHRVLVGRTTFLITHRLSQIRWADRVLVLRKGEVVDYGTHDELMLRCNLYQRIFGHYDLQTSEPSAEPRAEVSTST